jgi:hypothetical protein
MKTALANSTVVALCIGALTLMFALPSASDFDLMSAAGVWLLDEGEGEEAKDSSPTGDHGTFFRDPVWVDGKFGKALEFDGQNFVWMKNATGVPLGTSPRTLMCHFKWAEINDWVGAAPWVSNAEYLISAGPGNWGQIVAVGIMQQGGAGLGIHTFNDRWFMPWDGDTDWHHLAVAFPEGSTNIDEFLIYFDGVLQEPEIDQNAGPLDTGGGKVTIACESGFINNFFKGIIDDAAIFPYEMPAEDIVNIAKRGLVKGQGLDVSPNGKLATSWGGLKGRH